MDVVEAFAEDWERPPFELTQDEKYFYGRGTIDNKLGVAQLVSTFIRLEKEGFVPTRDLYLVFSGDEESDQTTTAMLARRRPDLLQAEFALNSDGLDERVPIEAFYGALDHWSIIIRELAGR